MLSIIVPVRNESDMLKDVFNHFTSKLTILNYEVLIINDFSEDEHFDKAKHYIET
jgi:glycosyltransferase involved in cell wall biosynthesis